MCRHNKKSQFPKKNVERPGESLKTINRDRFKRLQESMNSIKALLGSKIKRNKEWLKTFALCCI